MTAAGKKLIKGLEDALAFVRGDKTKGTLYLWHRCQCCQKQFSAPEGEEPTFCRKCRN